MAKRINPYRQKMPTEFLPLIDSANALKLYLVQEIGPTSFVFKDDDDDKFKVSIGPTISCSCSKNFDHCEHTLYVMLKIFKRDKNDPLIWQNSFIDNEINDLIKSRFEVRVQNENQKKKFLQKKRQDKNGMKPPSNKTRFNRLEIDGDTVCPICQEMLDSNEQALTFCKKKCGNNFHIKCIKVWVQHKLSQKEMITCPMCRVDWGCGILDEILREEDLFINRFIVHKGKGCQNCNMKPIKGNLFHCLYCQNYDLCEACYKSYQHFMHNKFLMKIKNDGEWLPAFNREKQYVRGEKNQNLFNFCKTIANYENFKPEDLIYEVFENQGNDKIPNQKEIKKISNLNDYIIDSIPNLENSINDYKNSALNSLQIVGVELMTIKTSCIVCNENSPKMKKLFCGHLIDRECLKKYLFASKFCCPIDGTNFLEGLTVFNKENNENLPLLNDIHNKKQAKRSNTFENKNSGSKKEDRLKLEINSFKEIQEENKLNVISNIQSGNAISEIRKQALEQRKKPPNKFRITSVNKKPVSLKEINGISSVSKFQKVEELNDWQLIGNNCLFKKKT